MEEITVVQDFMSDDFFTSGASKQSFQKFVKELREQFDAEDTPTPLSRWSGERGQLLGKLMRLEVADSDAVIDFYRDLLDLLGYFTGQFSIETPQNADGSEAPYLEARGGSVESLHTLIVFASPQDDVEALLDKHAATLLEPMHLPVEDSERTEDFDSAGAFLSQRFAEDNAPAFALVLAGKYALLTEQQRWQEGRYVAIDLSLLFERNDTKKNGAVDRFFALASAAALAPNADESIWFSGVLEESVKFTESVSDDLREAVRESIEIIANDVVRRRREQGLEPLPQSEAQELAKEALRFLYRILFLLYSEASPELEVVPAGTAEYQAGYSLDRLRDLTLVPITNSGSGTHLYDSLAVLFRLVQDGHNELRTEDPAEADSEGLVFHSLEADLFSREATKYIDQVGLSNEQLQNVLSRLLMTRETGKRDRGFISYAELGINQLGRVYEGLMSYTGFFAETDLYEVAPDGKADKGSWVVPVSEAEEIEQKHFVTYEDSVTGERRKVLHPQDSFVFRLSGRERQQSASYYTPEVLTRFTVSQALEELITDDMSAEDILQLTVCEPALGSGAFALEAVNQLAQAYLKRRQDELGQKIDPGDYPAQLQRTKAYIALHNVYGVDLNSTAVELAEITLWLGTMVKGLAAPWFGLRLRRGNSLIGARRSTYTKAQIDAKDWLTQSPTRVPMSETRTLGTVYQFLLPGDGWGAAADSSQDKKLAPEGAKALRTWRNSTRKKLTKAHVERLQALSERVDAVWEFALHRLLIAEAEMRRTVPLWGREETLPGSTVTRAQIEEALRDANGSYQRLRRVMDAWCALWFWPLTEIEAQPPTVDEWLDGLEQLLGTPFERRRGVATARKHGQSMLDEDINWDALGDAEYNDRVYAGAVADVASFVEQTPWLQKAEQIAQQHGFFHWELDFATVFSRGGFDLQVGNPPWVRPRGDVEALLAEFDVWWTLAHKPSQAAKNERRTRTLEAPGAHEFVTDGSTDVVCLAEFVRNKTTYPLISGTQPDLYRCFMEQTWKHVSNDGIVGLIHPETHLTDQKAVNLRGGAYRRLRRHWQFVNELMLFEIDHHVQYGVHVYGKSRAPEFIQAVNLYHPDTAERSLLHDGSGEEPGLKNPEGQWDLRPHANRIVHVDRLTLAQWQKFHGDEDQNAASPAMVYSVNRSAESVLEKLSGAPRVGELEPMFSRGWDESIDRKNGRFIQEWGGPESWKGVILQGPHLHVADPFYKQPNQSMTNNLDWSDVDLEQLPPDAIPVTGYKPVHDGQYDSSYTHWDVGGERVSARDYYRIAWRRMAANTGERTLIPAIIPPGAAHVNPVHTVAFPQGDHASVVLAAGVLGSLLNDFAIRVVTKSEIGFPQVRRLPHPEFTLGLRSSLALRVLRLNCLTDEYAELWNDAASLVSSDDKWTCSHRFARSVPLGDVSSTWTPASPLRLAADRYQAQVEIDALVALSLGITADELCAVYRTQFPVLYGYDQGRGQGARWYDVNGRLVPGDVLKVWETLGDSASSDDFTATNAQGYTYEYVPPFITLDREEDMRTAYAEFERRFGGEL
ncbi:class I SAM-dependent DNA methyltransferase [Auritidibacter sp. NML100628]|nr:class I SAM-dependent DNA methyltransferase [Auritidibacter sp. NML100628]PXA75335.1 restriction endonuclease subunit M [Auritidibacter sp. NML100628]